MSVLFLASVTAGYLNHLHQRNHVLVSRVLSLKRNVQIQFELTYLILMSRKSFTAPIYLQVVMLCCCYFQNMLLHSFLSLLLQPWDANIIPILLKIDFHKWLKKVPLRLSEFYALDCHKLQGIPTQTNSLLQFTLMIESLKVYDSISRWSILSTIIRF